MKTQPATLEVSRRGLSFLTRRKLALSAPLSVVIRGHSPTRLGESPRDFFVPATILRSVSNEDDQFRVSVRFIGATLPIYSSESR